MVKRQLCNRQLVKAQQTENIQSQNSKCKFTQIQTHRIDFNARFNPHLSLALTIPHRNAIIIEIFELGFSYVYKSILKFDILVHNAWWIDSDTG